MALRDVNLIPADIVSRRYVTRHITVWAVCLVVALAAIWGGYAYTRQAIHARGRAGSPASITEAELREAIAAIVSVQAELEGLSFVSALLDRRTVTEVLWKLSELINDDTHLSSLQMGTGGDPAHLALAGISKSNSTLGDFVSRLSQDAMFARVDLKFSQEHSAPGAGGGMPAEEGRAPATAIRFEIVCRIAEP